MNVLVIKKIDCGANAPGGGGFQPGNDCAVGRRAGENSETLAKMTEGGGFTYNPVTGDMPKTGFALSVFPEHELILDSIDDATPEVIADYVIDKWEHVKDVDDVFVGGWYNKKTADNPKGDDKVYLDLSIVLQDKDEAIKLARKNRQLKIYDLAKFEDVIVMTAEERAEAERAMK